MDPRRVDDTPHSHLKVQAAYLARMAELSIRLVQAEPCHVAENASQVLDLIGTAAHADHGYIFRFTPDQQAVHSTHDWSTPGETANTIFRTPQTIASLPMLRSLMAEGSSHSLTRNGTRPPLNDSGWFMLDFLETNAILLLPLILPSGLFGFLLFDSRTSENGWPEDLVTSFRITADLLANYLQRIESDALLRTSEERWRFAIEGSGQGLWDWNTLTNEVFFSPGISKMLGYREEDFSGRLEDWSSRVHPDDLPSVMEVVQEHLDGITPYYDTEHRMLAADGTYKWIRDRGMVMERDASGAPLRMVGTHIDVTARHQYEEDLALNRDSLSRANEMLITAMSTKDSFLATMSHELRTPLTSIIGLTEVLLRQDPPLTARQLHYVEVIQQSGSHLMALINDTLDMAKIEAGMMDIHPADVSVDDVCEAALNIIRAQATARYHVIETEYHHPPIIIRADKRRLTQMVMNLLSNAVKFTEPGGRIVLRSSVNENEESAGISVTDTGIGISEDDLRRLFVPFSQIDSSHTRAHAGTGLGLALVQRMAHLHDGRVDVSSTPGKGSTFTIVLPLHRSE